ncbi:MAG: ABC transporter substrate-binding protein [Treponema sp.]|jgi:peptide/nickel transport system substrate-binding protein|nr:ABC transporter substrate-binding protein [Treponema sp.]
MNNTGLLEKRFAGLAAAFALGGIFLFLVSCGGRSSGEKAEAAAYRREIHIALTAQPPTLDSAMTVSQVALQISNHIFEQLYNLNADYTPVPELAESVTVSSDGLNYTFPLRRGVYFHNGKELRAEDVTASMNRWLKNSSRAKALLTNSKFEELDPYTVRLTVEYPASDILIVLATWAQFPGIMPREIIEAVEDGQTVTEYIGTGPYKFGEWKQDQYIRLDRYEQYKSRSEAPSGFSGAKSAPTEYLYFYFVTDQSTRVAGLKTGQYDVTSIPTENYEEFEQDPNITIHPVPGGVLSAYFNTRQGPLANLKLRQAALAVFNNTEILLASFSNPKLYFLNPGFTNPAQTQWLVDAGKERYNEAAREKAKQLMAEAGYRGETITILATPDYSEMYNASLVIQEELRQAGFTVNLVSYDFPTWLKTKSDLSTWDIFVASTGYQLTPPQLLAVTPDWAGLQNDTVSRGLRTIRSASDGAAAKQEWAKVQQFLYDYAAATSIGHYTSSVGTKKTIEGFESFLAPVLWNARLPE